ncbi:hypothetical protein TI39_contig4466g00001 [Zymoseptoria brevis]|uniref:DUF862-domain-containing protein n=1 Tax=Zymoseptoria brevis TaxID=1047168 RepID=A0A0F4G6L5_9PEZI|nr:hypothetical protein TI39_contig4466g00001 [Zymoseptoria brevis]
MNLFKRSKDKSSSEKLAPEDGSEEKKSSISPSAMTASMKQYFKKSPKESKEPEPSVDNARDVVESDKKKSTMSDYAKQYFKQAQTWTADEAVEAKKALQKAAGLGARPDVIPEGEAHVSGEPRTVELGWHPVAGATGKWFAASIIGKQIQDKIGSYPDPTQHWAVIAGDYVHQLWMDENLDIIYINEKLKREDWHLFEVGKTRFNDQALREASRMTIHNMREKRPAYNLISNNCQNFAVELLKAIQVGAHLDFGTSFAIYQRATGKGAIMDLFAEQPEADPPELQHDESEMPPPKRQDTVNFAQHVMDENTTKLDHDGDPRRG